MESEQVRQCKYCGLETGNQECICPACYEEAKVIDIETGRVFYNFDLLE